MKHSSLFVMTFINNPRIVPLVIGSVCAGSLIFAWVMQYGFDLHPCILCLWQRVPFGVALLGACLAGLHHPASFRRHLGLSLVALSFMTNLGLALFHTGVERQWWLGTKGCSIHPLSGGSVADMRAQLLHTVQARCDEITWTLLGLSMANWNVLLSFCLSLYSIRALALSLKSVQHPSSRARG